MPLPSSGLLVYAGILVAAIIEGEIAYIGAAALVAQSRLDPLAVVVAGAIGAAIGDQAFFFVFRGRLTRLMARWPSLERKTLPLIDQVRQHDTWMVLLIRFAPGLRVAIAAACALVDVSPLKFSLLNLASSVVWAVALLGLVGWLGPSALAQFGLGGWRGAAVMGLVVLGAFAWLGRFEARAMHVPDAPEPATTRH